MIKVENIDVFNFEGAIRGMRNPMNSWDKSDSNYCDNFDNCNNCGRAKNCDNMDGTLYVVGKNDLNLMRTLYNAGSEHRKYLRQIFVSMDITAPLYWY